MQKRAFSRVSLVGATEGSTLQEKITKQPLNNQQALRQKNFCNKVLQRHPIKNIEKHAEKGIFKGFFSGCDRREHITRKNYKTTLKQPTSIKTK